MDLEGIQLVLRPGNPPVDQAAPAQPPVGRFRQCTLYSASAFAAICYISQAAFAWAIFAGYQNGVWGLVGSTLASSLVLGSELTRRIVHPGKKNGVQFLGTLTALAALFCRDDPLVFQNLTIATSALLTTHLCIRYFPPFVAQVRSHFS